MLIGLLLAGGFSRAMAQQPMTIAQLFDRIEAYSKVLRASRSGVEAAELGIAPHDPLLNLRAGFTGPNGEPVLMGKQYYVGSRYVMVM